MADYYHPLSSGQDASELMKHSRYIAKLFAEQSSDQIKEVLKNYHKLARIWDDED